MVVHLEPERETGGLNGVRSMNRTKPLYHDLASRRRDLGIPYSALAELSGVSQPVVQRLLSGKLEAPRFPSVVAVARALGLCNLRILEDGTIRFDARVDAQTHRAQQAWRKARKLVGMVQGTSGLESQAVSQAEFESMVERTYHELLAGSNHRLWSR
jgi:transcriptional regulator with XRE-family HTH domain